VVSRLNAWLPFSFCGATHVICQRL